MVGTGKWLRFVGVLLLVVAGFGCGDDDDAADTSPEVTAPPGGYTIDLDASVDGDTVNVNGTTNLPDGTLVTVLTKRVFLTPGYGTDNPRAAHLGGGQATVTEGSFSASVPIDYGMMLVGIDLPGEQLEVVSPNIGVCAEVRTGVEDDQPIQPDEVRSVIGDAGEGLEGSEDLFVFGSATDTPTNRLRAMVEVPADPPMAEIEAAQGSRPTVEPLDGFC